MHPKSTENYFSFSHGQLRFIDSVQFLLLSLDDLVKASQRNGMRITNNYEPDSEKRSVLQQKCIYQYEYMDSRQWFAETPLAQKAAYYSQLSNEHIPTETYPRCAAKLIDLIPNRA